MITQTHTVPMPQRKIWTLVLASLGLFMVALDTFVVTTALPVLRVDLGASLSDLEWTVNAYNLSFACLLLTGAALGDRFGRRRMFTLGLVLFTVASAAAALSPSVTALIAARAVQGAGAAVVMPLTLTLISEAFPAEKRGMAVGLWGGIAGLAVAAGPVVGGAVIDGIDWHWIFWLNVPIGLAVIPLAASRLSESFGPRPHLDIIGLVLAGAGLLGLTWGLVRSTTAGWGSVEVIATLTAGADPGGHVPGLGAARPKPDAAARAVSQARLHDRQRGQLLHVLRDGRRAVPDAAVLPDRAGQLTAPGGRPHAPLDGHADGDRADRRRPRRPLRQPPVHGARHGAAGDRTGLGRPGRQRRAWATSSWAWRSRSQASAPRCASQPSPTPSSARFRRKRSGVASGTNSTLRELGGVFGVAVLAAVFTHQGVYTSPPEFIDRFQLALWVAVGFSADRRSWPRCSPQAEPGASNVPLPRPHVSRSSHGRRSDEPDAE